MQDKIRYVKRLKVHIMKAFPLKYFIYRYSHRYILPLPVAAYLGWQMNGLSIHVDHQNVTLGEEVEVWPSQSKFWETMLLVRGKGKSSGVKKIF